MRGKSSDRDRQRRRKRLSNMKRNWFKFSRNHMSLVGLVVVAVVAFLALFAPFVSPHPESAGRYVNFADASSPPSWAHPFGTDLVGRDIMSRTFFAFRFALLMGGVVLVLVVPVGVALGLIAGYSRGTILEKVIMRITDIFVSVPAIVLAMAVTAILSPNLFNAMLAVSLMWWPWYTRLIYGLASSLREEYFVRAAEVSGGSVFHILLREMLPNCIAPILTKMSLDMGYVILIGASLSFVGLGAQAPTPDLGTMVSNGSEYLPDLWWMSVFPAIAIVLIVLGFNLLGDGIRDMFGVEKV